MTDRTQEFQRTVSAFSKQLRITPREPTPNGTGSVSGRELITSANHVKYAFLRINQSIDRLSELASQSSIFRDASMNITEQTHAIKASIDQAASDIELLDSTAQAQAQTGAVSRTHSVNSSLIVRSLQNELAESTRRFSNLLKARAQTIKQQQSRRQFFHHTGPSYTGPRRRRNTTFSSILDADTDHSGGNSHSLDPQGAYALQEQEQEQEHDKYASRNETLTSIESTVEQLGGMYADLVTHIQEQGEVVIRIDADVDTTLENVEQGHKQLLYYWGNISNTQQFIIKVFAIIIVVSLVLIFTMRK